MGTGRYIILCFLSLALAACIGGLDATNANLPATTLAAQPGNAKAYVNWDQIPNVPDYVLYKTSQIELSVLVTIDLTQITNIEEFTALFDSLGINYSSEAVTGLTFEDDGLTNGLGYCYAVAGSYNGYGPISNTDCVVPIGAVVPTALATSLSVLVEWAKMNGASSYNLYWQSVSPSTSASLSKAIADTSGYELIANIDDTGADNYSYNHTGLSNCTNDHYIIKPVNEVGEEGQDAQEVIALPRTEGVFDEDFGDAGIIIRNSREGAFTDLAFLSDGSIVALMNARVPDTNRLFKFSSDGTYITNVDIDAELPQDVNALAVDASDNIYVTNGPPMSLCKYNSNLQLVTSYATNGCYDYGVANTYGYDLAIDSSGRIVMAGKGDTVATDSLTVRRFTTAGALDNTFDADGEYIYATSSGNTLIILDGTIYVAGAYAPGFPAQFLLLALNESNGAFIDDYIEVPQGNTTTGNDIKLFSDGTLFVAGTRGNPSAMAIWNLDTDLSLIDVNTYNHTAGAGNGAGGRGLLIDCVGKPVVAGTDGSILFPNFAVIRTNADFSLDDFGNQVPIDGWFIYDWAGNRDAAYKTIEDEMGRLYVSGSLRDGIGNDRPVIFVLK